MEDVELDIADQEKEGFSLQVSINIRVVVSETKKFSLTMQRSANDRVMDIAAAIGEMKQRNVINFSEESTHYHRESEQHADDAE